MLVSSCYAKQGDEGRFKQELRKAVCEAHVWAGWKHLVHCARARVSSLLLTLFTSLAPPIK